MDFVSSVKILPCENVHKLVTWQSQRSSRVTFRWSRQETYQHCESHFHCLSDFHGKQLGNKILQKKKSIYYVTSACCHSSASMYYTTTTTKKWGRAENEATESLPVRPSTTQVLLELFQKSPFGKNMVHGLHFHLPSVH